MNWEGERPGRLLPFSRACGERACAVAKAAARVATIACWLTCWRGIARHVPPEIWVAPLAPCRGSLTTLRLSRALTRPARGIRFAGRCAVYGSPFCSLFHSPSARLRALGRAKPVPTSRPRRLRPRMIAAPTSSLRPSRQTITTIQSSVSSDSLAARLMPSNRSCRS